MLLKYQKVLLLLLIHAILGITICIVTGHIMSISMIDPIGPMWLPEVQKQNI
jgi:hypothetical protein